MLPDSILAKLQQVQTPFYYYDQNLLRKTLDEIRKYGIAKGYQVHFALKANNQQRLLKDVQAYGLGADCVSGGEIKRALDSGFEPGHIVFAGVGKSDEEILFALHNDIHCFNCESLQEVKVIHELATQVNKKAQIALRINPNIDADTHHYITTGLKDNKFGINEDDLNAVLELLPELTSVELVGIHFHIGSQIEKMQPFKDLCKRVNQLNTELEERGHHLTMINVGGGFGIQYQNPDEAPIPDFKGFFNVFDELIELKPHQKLHFELGRSVIGQCGSLITRVLYTKPGKTKNFAVVDAGMTEMIRPALYQALHDIEVLNHKEPEIIYDVVGPICESSDTFRSDIKLPALKRGDLLAIRSAGAYGEVMRSSYNLRPVHHPVFSDDLG